MIMTCYQDAEDRTIWICEPITTNLGRMFLVILIEDIDIKANFVDPKNENEWWTGLCVVSPAYAGQVLVMAALQAKGWDVMKLASAEDQAAALAVAEHRIVLWSRQSGDWESDLEIARSWAAQYNEEPNLLNVPFLTVENGRYKHERLCS